MQSASISMSDVSLSESINTNWASFWYEFPHSCSNSSASQYWSFDGGSKRKVSASCRLIWVFPFLCRTQFPNSTICDACKKRNSFWHEHQSESLKYDHVYRIRQQFPSVRFILNEGINSFTAIEHVFSDCPQLAGFMIGRWAYEKNPLAVDEFDTSNFIV